MSDKRDVAKSFLLEMITAAFHEEIIPEIKLNIDELHGYFDPHGITYKVLLDVIQEYDSNRITKLILKDALTSKANRSKEEADNLITRIQESRKMNPEEVDMIKAKYKQICYETYIEQARIKAGDDLELYSNLISTYKYKDLGTSNFVVEDLEALDTTQLTETYLNNPIKSYYPWISKAFAGREGYLRGSLGLVCGRPKSGKSMFLMTEAVAFARQGLKVHYLALGDLNRLDFLVRMAAIATNTSIEVVYSDVESYKAKLIAQYKENGGRITITCMSPDTLTPEDFYNAAVNKLGDYDVIIVDYDLNFLLDSDSQYERGGTLYNKLFSIKDETKCLLLVATQPNRSYWSEALLDDTCFIESSKKSMIVDFAITIGKEGGSGTHCGYINLPVNRRGSNPCHPYIMCNTGELFIVPESVYGQYSGDPTVRDFSYKELTMITSGAD